MADEFEMSEREENNETVRQSLVLDQPDGWETGGRPVAVSEFQVREYLKCKCVCCPAFGNALFRNGCDRCCCCFSQCFRLADNCLIDKNLKHNNEDERFIQIEEWMRGFSIWPLPLLTITAIAVEIIVFINYSMYSMSNNYMHNVMNGRLLFLQETKSEYWRWFTYSFVHANALHLLSNVISKLFLGLYLEIEHKVIF